MQTFSTDKTKNEYQIEHKEGIIYLVDKNNNRQKMKERKFYDIEALINAFNEAASRLESLHGCTNCTNCTNCTDCTDCTDCVGCVGCINCVDCFGCRFLVGHRSAANLSASLLKQRPTPTAPQPTPTAPQPTPTAPQPTPTDRIMALQLNSMASHCYVAAHKWWHDKEGNKIVRNKGEMLMLIVSEIAEAMEGARKNKMDDHLPNRLSEEVELADALIRIFDYAAAHQLDLGGAFAEKLAYNATRADHTHEARSAPGGKKF